MKKHLFFNRFLFLWIFVFSASLWGQVAVSYNFSQSDASSGLDVAAPGVPLDANIGFGSFKNSAGTAPGIFTGQLRLYQNTTKGGSIKIYAKNGATITKVVFNASGTTGPAKYSVDGVGAIPLSISSGKYTITGINATSEVEFWTVGSSSGMRIYVDSFDVTYSMPAADFPPVVTASSQTGTVGNTFSYQIQATENPSSYALVSGTLPSGLTLNTTTGLISGTPAASGTFNTTVSATNNAGISGPAAIDFTIAQGSQSAALPDLGLTVGGDDVMLPSTTNAGITINYTSSDPTVASISGNTLIIGTVGTATISASNAGNANYEAFSDTFEVSVATGPCGLEDFSKIGNESSYANRTWAGFGGKWTATNAREDQSINGKAITIRSGVLTSPQFSTGIGSITMTTKLPFADSTGNLTVAINGVNVGTIAYAAQVQTFSIQNINMSGDIIITVTNSTNARVAIDDVSWTCYSAPETTWNGTAWSNGTPDANVPVILEGDYSGASFESASLTVNADVTLTVTGSVRTGDVNNAGNIVVEDNASFIQTAAGIYSGAGTFTVNRNSVSATGKYAFWSSPVEAQNMYGLFPGTTPTYVMTYNTATDFYDILSNPATSEFGQGYSIKTPVPGPTASFVGTPNNGSFTTSLTLAGQNYNLVGNPYPSNLNLTAFYTANASNIESTLWFWDNTSGSVTTQTGNTTTNLGYATYNAGSGTWVNAPNGSATPSQNYAKTGQAFIIEAVGTSLSFNNTMRAPAAGDNFNKTAAGSSAQGKFWLKLSTPYNSNMMQAVTYQEKGSNGYDIYDSRAIGTGSDAFYSFSGTEKVVIQGKASFNTDDVVVLGNKHFEGGNFNIELVKTEGIFANGQAIYLKDKVLGTEINLQEEAYTFSSDAGEFSNRFEIVYKNATLATDSAVQSEVSVYRSAGDFVIASPSKINMVEVYDVSGRLIQSLSPNAAKATVTNLSKGVFIIKIKNASGTVSKKVIK